LPLIRFAIGGLASPHKYPSSKTESLGCTRTYPPGISFLRAHISIAAWLVPGSSGRLANRHQDLAWTNHPAIRSVDANGDFPLRFRPAPKSSSRPSHVPRPDCALPRTCIPWYRPGQRPTDSYAYRAILSHQLSHALNVQDTNHYGPIDTANRIIGRALSNRVTGLSILSHLSSCSMASVRPLNPDRHR